MPSPALERDAIVAIALAHPDEWTAMREVLDVRHFAIMEHRLAAEAIRQVRQSGADVAPRSVAAILERAGRIDAARAFLETIRRGRVIGDGCAVLRALAAEAERARAHILDSHAIFAPLPPVKWTSQGLDLAPGAPALFAGYGYSGKTLAAQAFALAVASGTKAWGRFDVRGGRAVHLDYEQGAYLTRWRYQRLARALDIAPADVAGRLEVRPLPDWYADGPKAYDRICRVAEDAVVVLVDSFRAACPATDENSSDARVPLDLLCRVSEATGAMPIVLHHARKPQKDSVGGAKMSIRGSGALFDACGSVFVFAGEKGKATTVTHEKARITGRAAEDFRLHVEDVEVEGDPIGGLRVSATDVGEAKVDAEDRYSETKRKVLEHIRNAGVFAGGVNRIAEKLGLRKMTVSAVLEELEADGRVRQAGNKQRPVYEAAPGGSRGTDET